MCHGTFDAEFGDGRLELSSDEIILRRPFFFRQRYNNTPNTPRPGRATNDLAPTRRRS
jgi:hypothetical protein